jgi:hypothetical protein
LGLCCAIGSKKNRETKKPELFFVARKFMLDIGCWVTQNSEFLARVEV